MLGVQVLIISIAACLLACIPNPWPAGHTWPLCNSWLLAAGQ
jgi:hypothetical protein